MAHDADGNGPSHDESPSGIREDLIEAIEDLHRAVESMRAIGTAVGMLMEIHSLTYDDAFALLVQLSAHRREKLEDIAATMVRSGVAPVPSDLAEAELGRGSTQQRPTRSVTAAGPCPVCGVVVWHRELGYRHAPQDPLEWLVVLRSCTPGCPLDEASP